METIRISSVAALILCLCAWINSRDLFALPSGSAVSIANDFTSGATLTLECKTSNFALSPYDLASKAVYSFRVKVGIPESTPFICSVTTSGFSKSFAAWPFQGCELCQWSVTEDSACLFDDKTSKFDICQSYK